MACNQICLRTCFTLFYIFLFIVDDSEISFGKGDRITNAEEVTYSRWIGTAPDGQRGMFPANQVKIGKDITNIQCIDLHWALNIVNIDYAGFEALSFKKLIIRNI